MCQGEASFSCHIYGYYVWIVRRKQFLLSARAVFYCRYKRLQEKQLPTDRKNNYLGKQTLKSRILLLKLCKENHRDNQKFRTFPFRLSFVLRQKQVVLLQDFVHLHIAICPHIFPTYNDIITIVEKTPHSALSSVIFVISMMLMNVFVCLYSFLNITVIPVHFYCLIFCFKFYYPTVDIIVNHLYLLFLRSRKTNTKCCDKNEKNPQ